MSDIAEDAWETFAHSCPIPRMKPTRAAFLAGYRRALEAAADDLYSDERAEGPFGDPLSVASWLRARAGNGASHDR